LPQPVKSLAQPVHLPFFSGDGEAWRLSHVHLLEVAVEGGLHIHVVHLPPFLRRQCKENPHGFHPRHHREGIFEVNAFLLHETARHQPGLVPGHHPLLVLLELVHPLEGDWAMAGGQLHQLPRLVLLHSLELLLHGGLPRWIALGFRVSGRLASMREVELGEESQRLTWRRVVAEDVLHRAVVGGSSS